MVKMSSDLPILRGRLTTSATPSGIVGKFKKKVLVTTRWLSEASKVKSCVSDMLTVDEQGFERFWGPSAIKPLNFNYEFQPNFAGQNIWTLTDNLFVSELKRAQDEGTNQNDFMNVIHTKLGNVGRGVQKESSKYKQFPSIDQDIRQKSSSAQGSYVSRRLKIFGSPLTGSSQKSKRNPEPAQERKNVQTLDANSSSTCKIKPQIQSSPRKFVGKKQLATPPKFSLKKRPQQSGVTLKLSQQETEKLLKSLDFKVRTVRKPKPRDRSKSEAFGRRKIQIRTDVAKKRLSASKLELRKPGSIKKCDPKKTKMLENQGLLRSSQMPSSSEKDSRSSSGLSELVGPLPRVNWTPTQESIQIKKSSSASLKKKSSQKSGASVSKGSKTSTSSKKIGKNPFGSQDISRDPSSQENAITQQKVKTTRVKIIPKLTLNNQLLKSTTRKTESKLLENKPVLKAPSKKKDARADSILWTPEKVALLDQITNDKQLKAVLMSAGDTYMKTRKYFAFKSNVKTKPPLNQASSIVKKEPTDKKKMTNTAPAKTTSVSTAKKTDKKGNVGVCKTPSKEIKSMASDTLNESLATLASKPEASQSSKSPDANVQPIRIGDQKQVTNSQLLKTEGVPKTSKNPKSPARKVANSQSPLKDNKMINVAAAHKKRLKHVNNNSRQVRKVEERLAQLSAEVTGNSTKLQEKKVPQAQHANLDHLRKIIDKSLSKFKEDKVGEIKSDL